MRSTLRASVLSASSVHAAGLLVVSSAIRALGALAAVVLAYGLGTSQAMDRYTAFSLAVVSVMMLGSLALPGLLAHAAMRDPIGLETTGRSWGRFLGNRLAALYVLASPGLAWTLTPSGGDWQSLCTLLWLATGAVWAAPRSAIEQTLHQQQSRPYYAMSGSAAFMSTGLVASAVTLGTGELAWAASAWTVGGLLEYGWLRRAGQQGEAVGSGTSRLPVKDFAVLTAASSGAFLVPLIDQVLLAMMGPRAQALWGLASRAPSFLTMSVFAAATALAAKALMQGAAPGGVARLVVKTLLGTAGVLGLVWVFALPLTAALYERGVFSAADTRETAAIVGVAVWTYLGFPASILLIRAAGAKGARQALVLSTAAFVAVKGVCGYAALGAYGFWAVGLSTALATAAQCAILWSSATSRDKPKSLYSES